MFMKKILLSTFILAFAVLFSQAIIAQSGVKGVVKDSQTKETLVGANIVVSGTTVPVKPTKRLGSGQNAPRPVNCQRALNWQRS